MQRFSWVLLVLLVLLGCSEEPEKLTGEEESIEELIIQLGSDDSYIANKASERLVERGDKAVPELLKVLDLPDTNSRHELVIGIFREMKSSDKNVLEAIDKYAKRKAPVATTVRATPPPGSAVAADGVISLAFNHPVESVPGATGNGRNWTIPVRVHISITWKNINGSDGGPMSLTYKLIPLW